MSGVKSYVRCDRYLGGHPRIMPLKNSGPLTNSGLGYTDGVGEMCRSVNTRKVFGSGGILDKLTPRFGCLSCWCFKPFGRERCVRIDGTQKDCKFPPSQSLVRTGFVHRITRFWNPFGCILSNMVRGDCCFVTKNDVECVVFYSSQ